MTDIVAFLEARITEDEQLARTVAPQHGHRHWQEVHGAVQADNGEPFLADEPTVTRFVTAWDPARVLAECAAKRNLIHLIDGVDAAEFHSPDEPAPVARPYMRDDVARGLLLAMAHPYADHADYDPEWTS